MNIVDEANGVNTTNKILRHFSTLTLQLEGEHQLHQTLLDLEFAFGHISNHVLNLKLGLTLPPQFYQMTNCLKY